MKEKVFITGANGMLGASVVRTLLADGFEVLGLIYPGSNTQVLEGLDVKWVEGDICQDIPLDQWLADCDFIIHVAASTSIWPRRSKKVWQVNYDATLTLAEAAKRNNIRRFVHLGTANSFDKGTKDQPGVERGNYEAAKYGIDYMDSKEAVQKELIRMHVEDDFPVIVVNPTFMIGPYDSGPSSGRLVLNALQNNVPGFSTGGRSFVYSGDVARAVVNALHKGRVGECYLAAGQNLSFQEFFQLVFERIGVQKKLRPVPRPLALIGGAALSIQSRITGKPPRLGYTMAKMSYEDTYYSNQKALDELDMPETPLSQAIDECAHWLRNHGYVSRSKAFGGKTAIITGSSQGIGKALAHALLSEGANVVLNGRSADKEATLLESFGYAASNVTYVAADVSAEEGGRRLVEEALNRFGSIDILINNAGMSSYGDLEDSNPQVIRQVLDSNITGALLMSHLALPHLRASRGSILFTSSLAGLHGLGGHSIYSVAKMSMIALAQALKKETKRHGMFVGYACVGFTANDEVKRTLAPDGSLEAIPSRPGIKPVSQAYAARTMVRQLRKKKFRVVHTTPGKLLYFITRLSERLSMLLIHQGYEAERKFLDKMKRDNAAISSPPTEELRSTANVESKKI